MMALKKRFAGTSIAMVVFGLAFLLAIVASAFLLTSNTSASFEALVKERQIRSSAVDLFSLLQDAESGQRGYLITRNDNFLKPYNVAIGKIKATEIQLTRLVADRPAYLAVIKLAEPLIQLKMTELAQTINQADAGQMEEALKTVQDGFGLRVMEKLRDQLQAIVDLTDQNINSSVSRQISGSNQLKWVIIGAAIAIIIVMGGAIFIIVQHVKSLNEAHLEVQELNKDLEDRVNERTHDLVRANQEIQRFAYIVTHDLRAPLVNIMGFTKELETSLGLMSAYVLADGSQLNEAEIIEARTAAAEDVPEAINFIRSSTSKMDRLINAILKISRDGRRQLKPERVDVQAVVTSSVASLQHLVDACEGSVELTLPPSQIVTDRLSLEQIFTNLVDNAIKYRAPDRLLKINVTASRKGRMFEIIVEDNGRGIQQEDLERVFELFRRAGKQDQVGEGIGLAHVRSMARNLGGDVNVESELGKGSRFILVIPADLKNVLRRVDS
jgi:signal transduction histidine kinase